MAGIKAAPQRAQRAFLKQNSRGLCSIATEEFGGYTRFASTGVAGSCHGQLPYADLEFFDRQLLDNVYQARTNNLAWSQSLP
jgi:hypothetical protein